MNLSQAYDRVYLLRQILLLGCGIAGFMIATRRCAWGERIIRWLVSAALICLPPVLLEFALHRHIPVGERDFPYGFADRAISLLPLAVAVIVMSLAYRRRTSALGRTAEASSLAVLGGAAAAFITWRMFRDLEYFPLDEVAPGLGFGICCWFVAAAYERSPRNIRNIGLAAASAFSIACLATIQQLKANLPDPSWSTERLVSALGSEDGYRATCTSDGERVIQGSAATLLAARGPEALPALRRAMARTNPKIIQEGAALALTKMGAQAAPALPELMEAWRPEEDDGILRNFRVPQALSAIGASAIPSVRSRIERGARRDARDGGFVIGWMGQAGLKAALELSRSPRPLDRVAGVIALAHIAKESPDAAAALPAMLNDADFDVSYDAARMLEIGGFAMPRSSLPRLFEGLRSSRDWVRPAAAIAVARISPGDRRARPFLLEAVREGVKDNMSEGTFSEALMVLASNYKRDRVVRDALIAALQRAKTENKERVEADLWRAIVEYSEPAAMAVR